MTANLSAVVFSFCTGPLWAQDQMTLLLDWFDNPDHGPAIIAQERGYVAILDLEAEIIAPADPSPHLRLVAADRADLAVSQQPALRLQILEGLPRKRIGTLTATPLKCLLVVEDGPIETPADLCGRRIGVSAGGVEEAVLGRLRETHGVRTDEVERINVNVSLSPALMSGQVDRVIGACCNVELNQMDIEDVPGRCFYVEEEGLPAYDGLIYMANPLTMDPDRLRRFLAATERAIQDIISHSQDSGEIFARLAPEMRDDLNRRACGDTSPRLALCPAAMGAGRSARFEVILREAGLIPDSNPVSDIAIDVTAP
ncbi:ABC transporter substrate-binding protein [Roseobacter sinensis]|uniref:ABC transporter substrate-binding protein n=1 Tax=Roseobacter sinensis TaxID=2931391 RepID=A0ABT3BE47_9RHOB|nr:ABC transporter substrate-binding protein [Roseobacter sp. WL0113]MCV3271852.1 ABC transporter substrate-binding protein [Roseobacter sp. WL0113]